MLLPPISAFKKLDPQPSIFPFSVLLFFKNRELSSLEIEDFLFSPGGLVAPPFLRLLGEVPPVPLSHLCSFSSADAFRSLQMYALLLALKGAPQC